MGASIKSKKNKFNSGIAPDINITPFVDILLVLLIVFMVATPAIVSGLTINLPKAKQTSEIKLENKNITVTIDAKKILYINDKFVSQDDFVNTIKSQSNPNPESNVIFLRGDKNLAYSDIMGLVNLLATNDYTNIVLVTEDV
ncbi:ExbD/TolR family protein [Candidatus Deianiraea vastatrix]|uniref:Biopolymer transport protein ExbD/TolR n=1 Tax=Candidatus Deianiraea vastatrix TaxID=2163644 RepID=A0A5B8XDT1_9RICK|nr:biopolymer transporter ExbD [Candidatus Deianiraea vastatrix]QED23509.1 Biopolymer transport protein ExbD/TolR [Candidatus Deianiraea vastatrix]